MATSTALGQNVGAGNMQRAERAGWYGAATGFFSMTFFGILLYFYAEPVAGIFIRDNQEVVTLSSDFVQYMALTFGFLGLQIIFNGAFRGAGQTTTAMIMAFIAFWVTRIPLAYFLSRTLEMGPDGIWLSFPLSLMTMGLLTTFWFWLGRWKRTKPDKDARMRGTIVQETVTEEGVAD